MEFDDSPKKFRIRDYTTEPLTESAHNSPKKEPKKPVKKPKKSKKKLLIGITFLLIISGAMAYFIIMNHNSSPVPDSISKSVSFPVYYPDQSRLPAGYVLDTKSFSSPHPNTVLYVVKYGSNKKLVFTIQKKPSAVELGNFNKDYIPINRQVLTPIGKATEGAINSQTVVSLPSDADNAWLLITGPSNAYGTNNLAQVLKSMRKAD